MTNEESQKRPLRNIDAGHSKPPECFAFDTLGGSTFIGLRVFRIPSTVALIISTKKSLIPWIDAPVEGGRTREEWKAGVEGNKILGTKTAIPMDGLCVRIGAMRCHSQAYLMHLRRDLPVEEINAILAGANDWVRVIPNSKEETLAGLTPAAVSGRLTIPVGRVRKAAMGPRYVTAFSVGDQLLWGAAEPLKRVLGIILESRFGLDD